MDSTFVTKISIEGKSYFLMVSWVCSETVLFDLKIFCDDKAWIGSFSTEAAKRFADRLKETADVYNIAVKDCLYKEHPMFKYDFKIDLQNTNTATFTWKKLIQGSSAVILHGSVELQYDNKITKDTLVHFLCKENGMLRNYMGNALVETKKMQRENQEITLEFEKLINIRTLLEETLYGKFAEVLNTKKRRIQVLEDGLNKMDTE